MTVTAHHRSASVSVVAHHLARTPPGRFAIAFVTTKPHVVHHGSYFVYYVSAVPTAVAVVVAFFVWRSARRDRARRALAGRLANPDPLERRRVLDAVDDEVLSRNSAVLFDLLTKEQDVDVLDALAAAVARSRWEPTDDRNLIELRRWVAGSHTRTTASTPAEPEPVSLDPSADVERDVPVGDHWAADPTPAVDDTVAVPADSMDRGDAPGPEPDAAEPAPAPVGASREGNGGEPTDELADFIPRVRALIGGRVERVELALITGTVLKTWSATETNGTSSAEAPTERTPGGPEH